MAARWLILPALLLAAPLQAKERGSDNVKPALQALMAEDARLQSIGWRLTRANAAFCTGAAPGIGLLLLDAGSFADPAAIQRALGIQGDFAIGAVAKDSPAERAGLVPGEEILAIDAAGMADQPAAAPRDYRRIAGLQDMIERQLAAKDSITLTVRSSGGVERSVTMAGEPACPSRFELGGGTSRAMAEGSRVIVGHEALGRNSDDGEAAMLIAHELAHNILLHPRHLDAVGRGASAVAATEREADRLAVWLIANAGYDPEAGVRFAGSYLRRIDQGLFRAPTHDGWRGRQALIGREVEAVRQARRAQPDGPLDWREHFSRQAHLPKRRLFR